MALTATTSRNMMSYSLDAILPSPQNGIKGDIFIRCPNHRSTSSHGSPHWDRDI